MFHVKHRLSLMKEPPLKTPAFMHGDAQRRSLLGEWKGPGTLTATCRCCILLLEILFYTGECVSAHRGTTTLYEEGMHGRRE
ncbi:hypothetical protein Krac_9118 [Ktedonobacter racemifer DSM 44963]|uniref:Uncharacterized protein n=1 Tax=Ktedonobacter racemifer DSM 44963 TaxID=485913 RepID=D6TR70_KTERA|nr:hypothetical protein Krac_9118 [Ktedonobacter racemifer DSM 44963]